MDEYDDIKEFDEELEDDLEETEDVIEDEIDEEEVETDNDNFDNGDNDENGSAALPENNEGVKNVNLTSEMKNSFFELC